MAIFCDGDFWHGRDWPSRRVKLARGANGEYWIAKIESNMRRDRATTAQLEALGWCVVRVWESEIRQQLDIVVQRIREQLETGRR
jgi:DNA mismatch endonuclease (patch repair protein)